MFKGAGTVQKKCALLLAAFFLTACRESSCCYVSRLQICEMPRFEGGFVLLQGKNKKKTGWERSTNCYLISVSSGSISVLASRWKTTNKKPTNPKPTQTQENLTAAKEGELEAIFCSSASFPITFIWQDHSLLSPKTEAFFVTKRSWILYMYPQGKAGLV